MRLMTDGARRLSDDFVVSLDIAEGGATREAKRHQPRKASLTLDDADALAARAPGRSEGLAIAYKPNLVQKRIEIFYRSSPAGEASL